MDNSGPEYDPRWHGTETIRYGVVRSTDQVSKYPANMRYGDRRKNVKVLFIMVFVYIIIGLGVIVWLEYLNPGS